LGVFDEGALRRRVRERLPKLARDGR